MRRHLSAVALAFFIAGGFNAARAEDAPAMPAQPAGKVEAEAVMPAERAPSAADILIRKHEAAQRRGDVEADGEKDADKKETSADVKAPPADKDEPATKPEEKKPEAQEDKPAEDKSAADKPAAQTDTDKADTDKKTPDQDAAEKLPAKKTSVDKSPDEAGKDTAAEADKTADVKTVAKPAVHKSAVMLPRPRPSAISGAGDDDDDIPIVDTDETKILPPYPAGAHVSVGAMSTYNMGEEDSLLDVARFYRLGYVELRAANPKVDPWTPVPGEEVQIPAFKLIPRGAQNGILVNLAQMRMYYFATPGAAPKTFPIGIGREGLLTPQGETSIVRKQAGPAWYPTPRMREEHPYLPAVVPPGSNNPLGTHALYLGWPEFRIHGTDKPWAIGRRVSSGCMRMYPEDIKALFNMVPVGTHVEVVDQPILVAWIGNDLYLEADPSKSQSNDIEISGEHKDKELTDALKKVIVAAAAHDADLIDWSLARRVVDERRGVPTIIASRKDKEKSEEKPAEKPKKDDTKKEDVKKEEAAKEPPAKDDAAKPETAKPEAAKSETAGSENPAEKKAGWSLESSDDAIRDKKRHKGLE